MLALRTAHDALLLGGMRIVVAEGDLLVFERSTAEETLLCAFNLGGVMLDHAPPQADRWRIIESTGAPAGWQLPPYGAWVAQRVA